MKKIFVTIVALSSLAAAAHAGKVAFDFQDPKGVNNVTFKLDAPLESINGSANGIAGTITTDPETLADFSGTLTVETKSMQVPNPIMNGHLHGVAWLDAKKFPQISFEVRKVEDVKREGETAVGKVTGLFTLHGVAKEITVPAQVVYLPGRLKERVPNVEGDLLVIRSEFTIKRSDYGIQPGQSEDKVAEEIKISLAVAGSAPKVKK
ncbi:MAG TPA: YceI family protein [Chthoniobacterales bacterium]|nr:YceI family protein [Chthoniobacterales bacterium]